MRKSSHRYHRFSQISTDFQNINDVWISGISGICVGKSENAAENTAFVFFAYGELQAQRRQSRDIPREAIQVHSQQRNL